MKTAHPPGFFCLEPGQLLRHDETVVRIVKVTHDTCELEHVTSHKKKEVLIARLLQEYREGTIAPCTAEGIESRNNLNQITDDAIAQEINLPLSDLSQATIDAGLTKIRYIRALQALGHRTLRPTYLLDLDYQKIIRSYGDTNPPKLSTLYKCSVKIEKNDGDIRAAFPNYKDRGGKGKKRWHSLAESSFNELVDRLKADKISQISTTAAEDDLRLILRKTVSSPELFTIMPSRSSIERRLHDTFEEYEIQRRKHGKAEADRKFRNWLPRDRAAMPLEVVEFDDKDSRCFLWDEKTMLPYGRAYITTGIDQFSKVPLGFDISAEHRNVLSAKRAYINAILPWDASDPMYRDVKSQPEFYGRFGVAIFDNALYNHAKELELLTLEISSSTVIAWAKPRTPTEKSIIEDFNGRMNSDFIEKMPGYGGPKRTNKLLSNGQESCCMTIQDFQRALILWAYDVYCNKPRNGFTPRDLWRSGLQNTKRHLPNIIDSALLASTLTKTKGLRPDGIQLATGLSYQSQELIILRRYLGHNAKVTFRYNPSQIDKIFVLDPRTNTYIVVPSTTPDYTKHLGLYHHKLILKICAERGRANPSLNEKLDGIEALQRLVEQLRTSKKKRERFAAQKLLPQDENIQEQNNIQNSASPNIEVTSELEASISEIEAIEVADDDDEWSFPTYPSQKTRT